ncbi:MAG: rhomboid family intramembrane serine protease [Acidobacteriota bacterium]
MFLPIGDSPNPKGTPWVTYALIGINVAVYLLLLPLAGQPADPADPAFRDYLQSIASERHLARPQIAALAGQLSRYDLLVFEYGFKPARPSAVDVITSMFLHGGMLHLLGNMLFLWIYGDNVEHRLGRMGYLGAYLGTGAVACLGDGLLRMGSSMPSVGASGAISGILGLYFLWFPRNRVRVWIFLFPFIAQVIELPARLVLGLFVVVDNLLPLLLAGASGGVAHGAHLGGFLAGLALASLLPRRFGARPERDPRQPASGAAGPSRAFRELVASGRHAEAAEWFFGTPAAVTRQSVAPADKVRLGRALAAGGHPRAALAAFQRALADHPRGPGRVAAHLGAAQVLMGPLRNPTGAYQHLYGALEEGPDPEERARARGLLQELSRMLRTVPRDLPG